MTPFERALSFTLRFEGGLVDHKDVRGVHGGSSRIAAHTSLAQRRSRRLKSFRTDATATHPCREHDGSRTLRDERSVGTRHSVHQTSQRMCASEATDARFCSDCCIAPTLLYVSFWFRQCIARTQCSERDALGSVAPCQSRVWRAGSARCTADAQKPCVGSHQSSNGNHGDSADLCSAVMQRCARKYQVPAEATR